jgi:hypothetical protein
MFTCLSESLHDVPATSRDMVNISKMGPMIAVGLQQLRVQRWNPPIGSEPPRANRARDEATQRVANSWHTWGIIEGTWYPQALYLSPNWEVSFMPLRVGWHLAVLVSPLGITWGNRMKPPSQGGISPCLVLWRGTCPCWLSPTYGNPGSTQTLTLALWYQVSDC